MDKFMVFTPELGYFSKILECKIYGSGMIQMAPGPVSKINFLESLKWFVENEATDWFKNYFIA